MPVKFAAFCLLFVCFTGICAMGQTPDPKEKICGKWQSIDKDVNIQVYMQGNEFKAKIIWYSDTEGKPMDYWTDRNNPDPALRSRKILGMDILRELKYHPTTNTWEDGMVYDSKHCREWNASAYINKTGELCVRGYWHFKFIGRTMTFVSM